MSEQGKIFSNSPTLRGKSIDDTISRHLLVIEQLRQIVPEIENIVQRIVYSLLKGGKVIWMGNGGSAADSQHLAAELVGRFKRDRQPIPSLALTSNMSILTAVANDMGYDSIFSRQIGALCSRGDIVIGISTSGESPNVLEGIRKASSMGACCIGFTGKDGGILKDLVDECILIPSDDTARIQEAHILVGHIICDLVEGEISRDHESSI